MNNELFDTLNKAIFDLGIKSEMSKKLFIDHVILKEYPKQKILFSENKKNEYEYILLKGILHGVNTNDKGTLITTGFYMATTVVTPHFARTVSGKSLFTLETLTDTLIAEIPVKALDNLRHNNIEINAFGQKIVENELVRNISNDIAHRSFSAKERLLWLRQLYPNLENLIPHHIIASYLGITNVSFSRLRSELVKK